MFIPTCRPSARIMLLTLAFALFMLAGCGRFDSPTESPSNGSHGDYWNPQPGDRVAPDHDVPILQPGYWESQGPSVNPFMVRTVVIGPAGGMLTLGPHALIVPAGAVNRNTPFTMSFGSNTGVAVDCNPSGLNFGVPITLVLSYQNTQYPDDNGTPPLSIYFVPQGGAPQVLPSVLDLENRTVSAQISHFSRYIIG
jgi:hypothetical protein